MRSVTHLARFSRSFQFAIVIAVFATLGTAVAAPPQGQQQPATNQPGGPLPPVIIPPVDHKPLDDAIREVSAAHLRVTKAQMAMTAVTRKFQQESEARPDVIAATSAVTSAKSQYDAAAAPILAAVRSTAEYMCAADAVTKAAEEVDRLKQNRDATPTQRASAATSALAAREALTKLHTDALAASALATTAKATYVAVAAALNDLRQRYDETLKQDPQWIAAKKELDDARAAAADADQKVSSARKDLASQQAVHNAAIAEQRRQQAAFQGARPR